MHAFVRLVLPVATIAMVTSAVVAQDVGPLRARDYMTQEQFRSAGLQKLNAKEMEALDNWFTETIARVIAREREHNRPAAAQREVTLDQVLNGTIIADDGEFLGMISTSSTDPKSISNEGGRYGSSSSATSIFNTFGRYGGAVGPFSPFNKICPRPPKIHVNGKAVCYLTVNPAKTPRIDPLALKAWLGLQ